MCINNLGSVHLFTGELTLADKHYQQAGETFARHEIFGLLADNLNDHGEVNILRGKLQVSVEQFKRSIDLNEKLGSQLSAAVGITNLGKAYGQNGRYQDALFYLEQAAERLQTIHSHLRLGTCEKYMALIWSRLGQPVMAHQYLDQSAAHYEMAEQEGQLAGIYNFRASIFFQQGMGAEAIKALQRSLAIAEKFGIRPQSALAKYLLGEALLSMDHAEDALNYLEQAHCDFEEMGMGMEQAACLISMGTHRMLNSEPGQARSDFEAALQLSGGTFPEIDWLANTELGNLAESQGEIESAIGWYGLGMDAFRQIHRNFLQPSLAGSYLQTPVHTFDRIISVISKASSALDALRFMEEIKASTLVRNLAERSIFVQDSTTHELDDLKAEIDALRDQLRIPFEEMDMLRMALNSRRIRDQLKKKISRYDEMKTRLERKQLPDGMPALPARTFDLDLFRGKANALLSGDWIALDYYITDRELCTLVVGPRDCHVISQTLSNRFSMALNACDQSRRTATPPLQSDLETLGRQLIPASVLDGLSPDTHLLIAPHRRLHQIPWPALRAEGATQPLVCMCTPCIIPSLQSLMLLWERKETTSLRNRSNGLMIGLSSFRGRYEELPMVREEVKALSSLSGADVRVLAEQDARWENLLGLRSGNDWARFDWLHVASHFSVDRHSGRLSGIALSNGDIWLDQLRDLSPLPGLISLSACNSNDSFVYEGDERVDLQTTCLAAGAHSVIGSTWSIADRSAAELTLSFYHYYLSGLSPASAVAMAQRRFIDDGKGLEIWAGFICAGVP